MGAPVSVKSSSFLFHGNRYFNSKPNVPNPPCLHFSSLVPSPPCLRFSLLMMDSSITNRNRAGALTICYATERAKNTEIHQIDEDEQENMEMLEQMNSASVRVAEKLARKKSERLTYLIAAIMSSMGIVSMAILSVYYRFSWQMEGGNIPVTEMLGTLALSVGVAVGDIPLTDMLGICSLSIGGNGVLGKMGSQITLAWFSMSHHKPREGPFELNDVFAIINAVPAIALLSFGIYHKGLIPSLCFGAGLGITAYGMVYMFVHDGLVHQRFPVGTIANVPYFRKVAAAHQIHHTGKLQGVPYGLFLGSLEVEEIGGDDELEKEINRRIKRMNVL